ncbi:MAG: hypothetical protein KatS3mg077_0474 [Candidatus Binatia bacterium]|nr:MAG: hypothetical protein KatS3mg077_0474 [Candidatus Binatia bacterium]
MPTMLRRVTLVFVALLGLGCGQVTRKPIFSSSLAELVPHNHRDHFVFVVERPSPEGFRPSALQVEHITKLSQGNEYEVSLSEDGLATGRVLLRDDGSTLWLLSEEDFTRGLRLSYDPPLPYVSVPLFAGEVLSTSSADLRQLSTNQAAGRLLVTQKVRARTEPAGQWLAGTYASAIRLEVERSYHGPEGPTQLTSTTVLVPGIGEVRSEGSASGSPIMRRQLACAIVSNRRIGDCRNLFQNWR